MDNEGLRAVIGIGSNSVRMLTARVCNGVIADTARYREDVRTFAGLTERGLSDDMMVRVMIAVMRLLSAARDAGVRDAVLIATSAIRDAVNAGEFARRVREGVGLEMRVLSGEEEARLGFGGATVGLPGRCGMIDIGGGSTELAVGVDGEPSAQISLQLGAARLARAVSASADPEVVLADLVQSIAGACGALPAELPRRWVGVGGTFHTLARVSQGGKRDIEGQALTRGDIERIADALHRMPLEWRASVPGLQSTRADIIVPGAWIALACARALGIDEILVTERGNLDGCMLTMRG
jgi:exopolyphosphatase/guanosine-5'-triphosphate,3'-diphosphate pyrophosphatase